MAIDSRERPRDHPEWPVLSPAQRAFLVLRLGLAAGVATGLAHAVVLQVMWLGFDRMTWYPRGFYWMAPVAYSAVLLPGVVVLAALAAAVRHRGVIGFAIVAIAATCVFGLLLPFTQVSRTAALILSAGVGWRLSVATMRHLRARSLRPGRFAMVSIALIGVVAGGQWVTRDRGPVGAAPLDSPNVLVFMLDAVRARNVDLSPSGRTPGFARLAAEGAAFTRAFSPAPWTLPSHASMFTGLPALAQSGDWYAPLGDGARTIAESLGDRGYATGAFVANLHYTGWDSGLAQGFDRYDDYPLDWDQVLRCSSYTQTTLYSEVRDAHSVRDIVRAFLRPNLSMIPQHVYEARLADGIGGAFLEWQGRLGDRPFFAFLNMMDAHLPFFDPEPVRRRYPPTHRDERAYDAAIAFMDAQVDSVLATLRRRGALDNTIVVVTSDHGELFSEHGLSGHANSLYLNVLHVPLVVRFPAAVPAATVVDAPVSMRRLAATLADLTGASDTFPGPSLRTAWSTSDDPDVVLAEVRRQPNPLSETPASRGTMRSLLDDTHHYILNEGTGGEEVYAYTTDTLESTNLATTAGGDSLVAAWRVRLADALRRFGSPPTSRP